ncbi:MAG: hypothetical protein GC180_13090 [Bacteroidetes bacterium]|nr:hypothetical protein [Bacteroidota bacterium]
MKHVLSLLALGLALSFASCGDSNNKKNERPGMPPEKPAPESPKQIGLGIVHDNIAFENDPNRSYSIYLPKGMLAKQRYPVLYCIDPHGRGEQPLLQYRDLADSLNIILVGSNTSKNGMSLDASKTEMDLLISEIQRRYPVESTIRLLGFSGGAKVAFYYADANPNVSQIIYSGAIYPMKRQSNISILGIAGKRDMNFTDLVSFDVSLGKAPFMHEIIEWDGKHEFPNQAAMYDGFYFLMNDSVENYYEKRPNISPEEVMSEQLLKKKFYQSYGTKDLEWWKKEIAFLHEEATKDVKYERILGFIGLGCYSYTEQAIKMGDVQKADYLVQIYLAATPDNEDAKRFAKKVEEMKKMRQ